MTELIEQSPRLSETSIASSFTLTPMEPSHSSASRVYIAVILAWEEKYTCRRRRLSAFFFKKEQTLENV